MSEKKLEIANLNQKIDMLQDELENHGDRIQDKLTLIEVLRTKVQTLEREKKMWSLVKDENDQEADLNVIFINDAI